MTRRGLFAPALGLLAAACSPLSLLNTLGPRDHGVRRVARDLAYGDDPRQRMDVYAPKGGGPYPTLVFFYGGGWDSGSRDLYGWAAQALTAQGFVVALPDYRLVPQVVFPAFIEDAAAATAKAADIVDGYGGDPARLGVLGHSAGAHLVAWLGASPRRAQALGVRPWKATVMLDSAALDVPALMARRHAGLYDRAFGSDPAAWLAMSPAQGLEPGAPPMLLVCSLPRRDDSCGQSRRFASQAQTQGLVAEVVPQNLSHRDINTRLGEPGAYTDAVDGFLRRQGAD